MTEAGLTVERIEALAQAGKGRGFSLLEFEEAGVCLRIRFERAGEAPLITAAALSAATAPGALLSPALDRLPANASESVRSPGVGRLLREHPLSGPPLPEPGVPVEKGALLGFVSSAGVLLPVRAPRSGRLGPALVSDGAAVAFGAPLFALD